VTRQVIVLLIFKVGNCVKDLFRAENSFIIRLRDGCV
jgi:hypothetical protein